MDTYHFISSLVASLAWPLTVVFIVVFLQKPLVWLIGRLQQVKGNGLEFNFYKDLLLAVKQTADAQKLPFISLKIKKTNLQEADSSQLLKLSKSSPTGAIEFVWLKLDKEVKATLTVLKIRPTKSFERNVALLIRKNFLNADKASVFYGLYNLRNQVLHASRLNNLDISEEEVADYIMLSNRAIKQLQELNG